MQTKWFIIAVLFPLASFPQDNKAGSSLNTIVSTGFVAGESTAKPLLQLTSGISVGNWFAGAGAGIDPYLIKSIPVYAEGRLSMGEKKRSFVYAAGGYNFPYGKNGNTENFFKIYDRVSGGFYMDAGVGYRVRLNEIHRLSIAAGYSRKNVTNDVGYQYPCGIVPGPCPQESYRYRYRLGRIVTKISWEFGK